jgi:hypothetical protein
MLSRHHGSNKRMAKQSPTSHSDRVAPRLWRPGSEPDHAADPRSFDRPARCATVGPDTLHPPGSDIMDRMLRGSAVYLVRLVSHQE